MAAAGVLEGVDTALGVRDGQGRERSDFDAQFRQNEVFRICVAEVPGSAIVAREAERICRLPLASPSALVAQQELIPDFGPSL